MITEQSVLEQAERLLRKAQRLIEAESFPWCCACRFRMNRHGVTRSGDLRWCCVKCGVSTLTQGIHLTPGWRTGSLNRPDKYERAAALFREGRSVRDVMKAVGVAQATATKYRTLALKDCDARCKCGQAVGHIGWCWWRYEQSPLRQEFMRKWHR